MQGASITFDPQIQAHARAHGRQLSGDDITSLSATLNATSQINEAGQLTFDLGGGRRGMLDDALDLYGTGMGQPITSPASSIPAGSNATARALATNAVLHGGRSAARLVEAEHLVSEHGSPWDPRSISRTRQALIRNLNPQLADRLMRQAGVRP